MKLITIITILGCFLVQSSSFAAPKTAAKPVITESLIDNCEKTTDCVIVPYKHCCGKTKRAINKKYAELYSKTKNWHSFDDPETCEIMAPCPDDSEVTKAACVNKKCGLSF